jgi:uncharacterized membrane protein YedE/YeeE
MNFIIEIGKAMMGGSLLAISSSLNLLLKGRITGISGIVYGLFTSSDYLWRLYFVLGLLYSSLFSFLFIDKFLFDDVKTFTGDLSLTGFIFTGFLVGLGTKLANGCTSGHGVCGLPRFSLRSIVACGTFFTFGVLSATLRQFIPLFKGGSYINLNQLLNSKEFIHSLFTLLNLLVVFIFIRICFKKCLKNIIDFIVSFATGIVFGFGLIISGMVKKTKVINFLNFASDKWDPSLLFVLLSAVGMNVIFFNLIVKYKKIPVFAESMQIPTRKDIDWTLIVGSIIFGIGWGISGMCPGPLLLNLLIYPPHSILFFLALISGQYSASKVTNIYEKLKNA